MKKKRTPFEYVYQFNSAKFIYFQFVAGMKNKMTCGTDDYQHMNNRK